MDQRVRASLHRTARISATKSPTSPQGAPVAGNATRLAGRPAAGLRLPPGAFVAAQMATVGATFPHKSTPGEAKNNGHDRKNTVPAARQMPGRLSRPGDHRHAVATTLWQGRLAPCHVPSSTAEGPMRSSLRSGQHVTATCRCQCVRGGHDWAGRALCDGIVIAT